MSDMAQPLRKPVPETRSYAERIRELVAEGEILEARALLAEALRQGDSGEDLSHWQRVFGPARTTPVAGERDVDRTADFQWLKEHSKEYVGQWIALFGGDLLAHDPSLKEVLRQLELHPFGKKALLHHIH
jgi:uncharacterized protein YoaH (UPF0181 family)